MKRAFSLIELSIVILIIGILVTGVTQSSRLITQYKLSTARSQTQSSVVPAIEGLTLWLETTSEASFLESEAVNSSLVSQWNDINPQQSTKFKVTQSTTGSKPTYTTNGLNGLPVLTFAASKVLSQNVLGANLFLRDESTIFIVQKNTSDISHSSSSTIVWSSTERVNIHATWGGRIYWDFGGGNGRLDGAVTASTFYNIPKIITFIRRANGYQEYDLNDGSTIVSATGQVGIVDIETTAQLDIGVNFPGYIAEIIIYNRGLNNAERASVESYLSKKWGIKIS